MPPEVYSWERSQVGDSARPLDVLIEQRKVDEYVELERDENPAYRRSAARPPAVPLVLVRWYAPLRRRELVAEMGALYPEHATPAVRWRCRIMSPPRVGDTITSVTSVHDKYVRRGRCFLEWRVSAHDQAGTEVLDFVYVNLWEPGRAEDRNR